MKKMRTMELEMAELVNENNALRARADTMVDDRDTTAAATRIASFERELARSQGCTVCPPSHPDTSFHKLAYNLRLRLFLFLHLIIIIILPHHSAERNTFMTEQGQQQQQAETLVASLRAELASANAVSVSCLDEIAMSKNASLARIASLEVKMAQQQEGMEELSKDKQSLETQLRGLTLSSTSASSPSSSGSRVDMAVPMSTNNGNGSNSNNQSSMPLEMALDNANRKVVPLYLVG